MDRLQRHVFREHIERALDEITRLSGINVLPLGTKRSIRFSLVVKRRRPKIMRKELGATHSLSEAVPGFATVRTRDLPSHDPLGKAAGQSLARLPARSKREMVANPTRSFTS